ncbi:MAG: D-2-hydroxyacid dehydrogenase [Planctomycetales bacterium]|nr:D-2-hydroxyacid dehydrogenase [Planctomycetales bacterium]
MKRLFPFASHVPREKRMNIVLCYPAEDSHLRQIQQVAPQAHLINAGQEGVNDALPDADIFCGHAKVPVDWDRVVQQGRLRWIQSSAAGMDHCLVPSVIASDIPVTSSSGLFAPQVAEQTMAMLLGYLRSLPVFFRAQQQREFIRRPTRDLRGKTVGIVGLGGNGRWIAKVLAPFEVRILATDLFPHDPPTCVESLWTADRLDDLLNASDVVILCVPLNADTQGLFDAQRLAQMKRGAILVNVARGAVVVEADLVKHLESGHISAALLDVTEVEPLAETSPLWDMPNVIITPHVGAQSDSRIDDTTNLFCQNLQRFLNGEPLLNLVDKRLGFPVPRSPSSAG